MEDAADETILDPHHSREHGKMILRAIDKGWIGNGRWPTGLTEEQVNQAIKERGGEATLKERAVLATFSLLKGVQRNKGIGARIATTMERQNQVDDEHDIDNPNVPPSQSPQHIGTQINLQINNDKPVEQQRAEILGIIDTLRERSRTGSDQDAPGGTGNNPGTNGRRKARKHPNVLPVPSE